MTSYNRNVSPVTTAWMLAILATAAIIGSNRLGGQAVQPRRESAASDVSKVLHDFYGAIGGRTVWNTPTTFETVSERAAGGGTTTKTREIRDLTTGRYYRQTTDGNGIVSETGFDGQRTWERSIRFRGYRDASAGQTRRVPDVGPERLRQSIESGFVFTLKPAEALDGVTYTVVETKDTTLTGTLYPVTFYLDQKTHLVRRVLLGFDPPAVQTYDEYRDVGGGRMRPFHVTSDQGGNGGWIRYTAIRYGVHVPDRHFEFREAEAGTQGPATPGMPLTGEGRATAFNQVWRTIYESHWDSTFNGRDWRAIRSTYEPRIAQAADRSAFHELLDAMVGELGQTHFGVYDPHDQSTANSAWFPAYWTGKELIALNAGSALHAAGLHPGDVILAVNGTTADALHAQYIHDNGDRAVHERESTARVRALHRALRTDGTSIDVLVKDPGGARLLSLPAQASRSSSKEISTTVKSRQIERGIALISLKLFFFDAARGVREALDRLDSSRGVIIDLRGNPGGREILLRDIANIFYAGPGSLGTMRYRHGSEPMTYAGSGERAYRGTVVVLTDEWSASSAEILAAALQETRGATVVGMRTAGAVLPSQQQPLETGAYLQYALADFVTPRGRRLEGNGVLTDVQAGYTSAALHAGRDEPLEAAVKEVGKAGTIPIRVH